MLLRCLARARFWCVFSAAGAAALLAGCASTQDQDVYRRAEAERMEYLEREVERLRADLDQAEEAMIWIESGMRSVHTRADAVSAIAEARVALDSACARAPWRAGDCAETRKKLEEAERQIHQDRLGTAVFFASRAQRIADDVHMEARRVSSADNTLFVAGRRVNLRAGPSTTDSILMVLPGSTPVFLERHDEDWALVRTQSGRVGWIFAELLRE